MNNNDNFLRNFIAVIIGAAILICLLIMTSCNSHYKQLVKDQERVISLYKQQAIEINSTQGIELGCLLRIADALEANIKEAKALQASIKGVENAINGLSRLNLQENRTNPKPKTARIKSIIKK